MVSGSPLPHVLTTLIIIHIFPFSYRDGGKGSHYSFKKKKVIQFIQAFSFYCNPSLFFPEDQGLVSAASRRSDRGWGLSEAFALCTHL